MKNLVKNAAVIAAGGLAAKVLGAVYRVPLTNILGAEGIGIYQMVFPFYCILLTLSSTGLPSGVAKLTAEGYGGVLKKSVAIFGVIGLIGALIMFFGAETLAGLQGAPSAAAAYKALSPSVFLVSVMSSLRGHYQGRLNMYPTALSQVIEQVVKLAVGLFLCANFGSTVAEKAALAALAVTASEVVALAFILVVGKRKEGEDRPVSMKKLVLTVLPITFCAIMLPLSKAADSFTAIRLIGGDAANATKDYGVYSGVVESVVALPVAVCYSLAVSGLPLIAGKKSGKSFTEVRKIILYTLLLGAVFAVGVFFFSGLIIRILYPNLYADSTVKAIGLLKISSLSVVGLSLVQSFTAALIGMGKTYVAPLGVLLGVAVKLALVFLLVPTAGVGVYGYAISDIFCYFVAVAVFLLYIIMCKKTVNKEETENATDRNRAWRKKRGYIR